VLNNEFFFNWISDFNEKKESILIIN
jgi:hypothetical protein